MEDSPRILVAPLDWGLGHATRCVPIIEKLIEYKAEVIIAADNRPYDFLKQEFPSLEIIRFPGYPVRYPQQGSMTLKMLRNIPGMFKGIRHERKLLKKIVKENSIDAVISDNRYGLSGKTVFSIFITHQLNIKAPQRLRFMETIMRYFSQRYIKKYDECWVPDYEGKVNLSGELSHKGDVPDNTYFLGPLSRFFLDNELHEQPEIHYDFVAVFSGPEPQRSIFEYILFKQLVKTDLRGIVARGMPESDDAYQLTPDITVFSHLPTQLLDEYMQHARMIICRPGYSSIMDIGALGKQAILIPTPGQTEQEYLGSLFLKNGVYVCQQQKYFDLETAIEAVRETNPLNLRYNPALLEERIENLLEIVKGLE
jgi:uncharacterized protein (TIGR00661 family)